MALSKIAVEKIVEKTMPGWKVVKRRPLADAAGGVSANTQPDAVSPGLAAQKAHLARGTIKPVMKKKSGAKKKTAPAQFVTVAPAGQPDTIRKFQKVVLIKGGKVIAQQG
jgi:hypothetical protein